MKGRRPHIAMSYELAGFVAEVGSGVAQLRVGDRMVGSLTQSNGICARCLSGRPFPSHRRATLDPQRDWVVSSSGARRLRRTGAHSRESTGCSAHVPRIDLTVRTFDVAEGWPIRGSYITVAVHWALSNPGSEPSVSLSCQDEFTEMAAGTVAAAAAGQAAVLNLSRALGASIDASSNGATPIC